MPAGHPVQAPGHAGCALEVALLEQDVDEQREERADHGHLADRRNLVVRTCRGPLEEVAGEGRLATGEVEGGERAHGVGVLPEAVQQLRRLLDAALPDS